MECSDRLGFHMPGHAAGRAFPLRFKEALWKLDNTEIDVLDNLNEPTKAAKISLDRTASVFGAAKTWYVTSGSTVSLKAAIASVLPLGGKLLMSRTAHKSIIHAVAELALTPLFFDHLLRSDGLLPVPLAPTEEKWRGADAMLVTSPDYYGRLVDLKPFVAIARKKNIPLIVDAAHGAHLLVDPWLKEKRALKAGADLVIESAHKTLAALTPGSYLHVSAEALASGLVDARRLQAMINIYQTSSPSFPIAASLEYAAWSLKAHGERLHAKRLEDIERFKERLPASLHLRSDSERDRLRLVFDLSDAPFTPERLQRELAERRIDIEMRDFQDLVLIVSLYQQSDNFTELADALSAIFTLPPDPDEACQEAKDLAELTSLILGSPPVFGCSPQMALFGDLKRMNIRLKDALGYTSALVISPTPPCIPLLWPGEKIDARHLRLLSSVLSEEAIITVLARA